jgi:L-Lysine epsilon oxidase N-terminal
MDISSVKYCKIFPGIGIARLGNSPDEFFIGPEAPGHPPSPDGGFKDAQGRVKKQAARFRIYGFDDKDKVVGEITPDDAEITWTVQLANTKASWHRFGGVRRGMDTDQGVNPTALRNKPVEPRSLLEIRPSARSATGPNQGGADSQFNDGEFMGLAVPLGEIRTDENGRLLVLGGNGKSERTADGHPITTYADR